VLSQDEGRRVGLTVLEGLGYNADLYRSDYPVWIGGNRSLRADFVAFGRRSPLDMTTATAVVEVASKRESLRNAAALAQALATPLVVLLEDSHVSLHTVAEGGALTEYARLDSADEIQLARLSNVVGPTQLLRAKLGHRQLGLFPVDVGLLDSARRRSEQNLSPLVDAALETAAEMSRSTLFEVKGSEQSERLHKQAARVVVGALTALALRDKEGLQDLSPGALADTSQQRYAQYFSWLQRATESEQRTLEAIIAVLGDGVDYRSLDPRVLASVYENSLVTDAHRKSLGTHYTPSALARRIMQTLPLEYIRPQDRLILDPTCGSGGLLLAAHDRLRELHPDSMNPQDAHAATVMQLRGFDKDDFAVELARLSLLLNAYPADNGWHIRQADVLKTRLADEERPSLIVANPPWRNSNSAGARREVADRFLHWMIDSLADRGFIAVVLPVGWLNNRNSAEARRELQERCDIFEVWRLPDTVFESSSMAPAVLFAQKRLRAAEAATSQLHLLKRVVRSESLSRFYLTGRADETVLTAGQSSLSAEVVGGPLVSAMHARSLALLSTVAEVITGPQPKPGVAVRGSNHDEPNAMFLPNASALPHLGEADPTSLLPVRFPADFQGGSRRGEAGLGQHKVIISAARSAENPWRLRVGFDREGIIVRNSLQMLLPTDPRHLLGLTAFLASTFAAAWIDETVPDRNIATADIRAIPVPSDPAVWDTLDELGARLVSIENRRRRHSILDEVDDLLWRTFAISAEVRQRVERRFSGYRMPDRVIRFAGDTLFSLTSQIDDARSESETHDTFGATLDARPGEAQLVIAGLTSESGTWTAPPSGINGWMLRPGTTFNVEIPSSGGLAEAKFSYQSESWLNDEELERRASALFDAEII
jgi:hypothetical protein